MVVMVTVLVCVCVCLVKTDIGVSRQHVYSLADRGSHSLPVTHIHRVTLENSFLESLGFGSRNDAFVSHARFTARPELLLPSVLGIGHYCKILWEEKQIFLLSSQATNTVPYGCWGLRKKVKD